MSKRNTYKRRPKREQDPPDVVRIGGIIGRRSTSPSAERDGNINKNNVDVIYESGIRARRDSGVKLLFGLATTCRDDAAKLVQRVIQELHDVQWTSQALNTQDDKGMTPLAVACKAGAVTVAVNLIEHGTDLELASADGNTALCWAASNGHLPIVSALLDHSASCTVVNGVGDALAICAASSGNVDVLMRIMATAPALMIAQPNHAGMHPLHVAAAGGHHEMVTKLLV